MACRYYDDLIVAKLKKWLPDNSTLRVLKPDESKRLFELTANDNADEQFKLPLIAVSRNNDIELLSTVKSPKSFDGLTLISDQDKKSLRNMENLKGDDFEAALKRIPVGVYQFNVIPIKLEYQLDIYTKTYEEGDEYVRSFLFKLINNPTIKIVIPYNDAQIEHIANIRVLSTVSDTSAISERIFSGQFTRWTIQLELQDAFLFSVPYRKTWKMYVGDDSEGGSYLEVSDMINQPGELEELDVTFKRSL